MLQDLYLELDGARRSTLLGVVTNPQFRELIAQDMGRIKTQLCSLDEESDSFKATYRKLNLMNKLYTDLIEWMEFVRIDILEEEHHVAEISDI
jgi:hypothetical protein